MHEIYRGKTHSFDGKLRNNMSSAFVYCQGKNQIVIYCIQKNLSYQLWNRTPALANRATISSEAGSEMVFARNNYPSTAEGI